MLSKESDQVIRMRRRTEQELRQYIESGQATENHQVNRLMIELEKAAIALDIDPAMLRQKTALSLAIEPISFFSLDAWRLRAPAERLEINTDEEENLQHLDAHVLAELETVNTMAVVSELHQILLQDGVRTIQELAERRVIHLGLEELMVYVRLAKAIDAVELTGRESFVIYDRKQPLRVSVPKLLLSAESFPPSLDSLVI